LNYTIQKGYFWYFDKIWRCRAKWRRCWKNAYK